MLSLVVVNLVSVCSDLYCSIRCALCKWYLTDVYIVVLKITCFLLTVRHVYVVVHYISIQIL